jgi:TPR repeat protein
MSEEPEPIETLRASVSRSEPESYYELAKALQNLGTPVAAAEAAILFLKAAQLGHAGGHYAAAVEARALDMRRSRIRWRGAIARSVEGRRLRQFQK